jgi:SAM-dependent methyltransferase
MTFRNTYADAAHAEAYARLEFANTYYLAYRDIPQLVREHVTGSDALDFGCGAGRSTRFLARLGLKTLGVDIAPEMVAKARELDPAGDYRLIPGDNFTAFAPASFDLVLSMFTFDNIPGAETKARIFGDLRRLLRPTGRLISVVSAPEIYWHEWASFSTRDFPENRHAKPGDVVRVVTTDFPERRPTEDILFPDESYRTVYQQTHLAVVATYKPLAKGDEPYRWVNETTVAPWVIYVLAP